MKETTPAELQRLLAAEFERQGWEYDLNVGRDLVASAAEDGTVDTRRFIKLLPQSFFATNRTTRADVENAVNRVCGGRILKRDLSTASLLINDNRHQLNLGSGASIKNSNVNVGQGTQVLVNAKASKAEILQAVEVLLRAGITGGWNEDAARDLAAVIEARDDIEVDDIRERTIEVVRDERPNQGRLKALLTKIAVGGLGGALATGITEGAGELISKLPL